MLIYVTICTYEKSFAGSWLVVSGQSWIFGQVEGSVLFRDRFQAQ